ncbi:MAG: hypothetical protein HYX66_04040 [Ignavibacteria bacterium]|nr:hypothetical protein [Ignavibacteria bacterium]
MKRSVFILASFMIFIALGCRQVSDSPEPSTFHTQQSSRMKRVINGYQPVDEGIKQQKVSAFWDVVLKIARIVVADVSGAAAGGAVAVQFGANPTITGAVMIVSGVASSVVEGFQDSLIAPGDPNPMNNPTSPYNGSKPSSIDSVGFLHNDLVKFVVANSTSLSYTEIRSLINTRLVNTHGWSGSFTDSIPDSLIIPVLDNIDTSRSTSSMINYLYSLGSTTEANYLDSLLDDLAYLSNNSYPLEAGLALIEEYKADTYTLSLSGERELRLKAGLSVMAYSLALWHENS